MKSPTVAMRLHHWLRYTHQDRSVDDIPVFPISHVVSPSGLHKLKGGKSICWFLSWL